MNSCFLVSLEIIQICLQLDIREVTNTLSTRRGEQVNVNPRIMWANEQGTQAHILTAACTLTGTPQTQKFTGRTGIL